MTGFVILAAVVGLGIGYKALTSRPAGKGGEEGLVFSRVEPFVVPPLGGYQLSTVDLGEGPVPLLTIPLDTWGGYAALFTANKGSKPNKESLFYKKGKFAVQLVHEEDATEQFKGYASGKWPLIWAPMDSLPLLFDALKADKRVQPKVIGLFDWSAGGDGILVRSSIKTAADLKGRIVLTSSNTPYGFFLLWYLAQSNLTGSDVKVVWVADGEKAVKMFQKDRRIVAWVSWTPYITDCLDSKSPSYVPDARLMISSKDANQLIADCYIVRNDFLQDRPAIVQAFVEAMMEAAGAVPKATYDDMADFYKLTSARAAETMLDDVHVANFPENRMFFDEGNSIGAYKVFLLAQEYYRQLGALPNSADYEPDQVLVPSVLAAIANKGMFADQRNAIKSSFNRKAGLDVVDLESKRVVLTNNVVLYFDPQQTEFDPSSDRPEFRNNMLLLDKVAEQTKFLAATAIELVGNMDTSMQETYRSRGSQAYQEASVMEKAVSKKRAEFVESLLVGKYGIPEDRIVTEGAGWDNPLDPHDNSKNRRVDVKFIALDDPSRSEAK